MMALHGVWLPPPSLHGTWSWTLTDAHLRPSQQIMPHNSYNKYVQSYWASEELKDKSEFLQHVNRINGFIIPWCVNTADDGCCFYCFSVLRKIGGEWIFLGGVDGCPVRSIDADHIDNFFYTTEGREKMRELAQTPFPSEHHVDYWYGSKNRPQVAILPKVDIMGDNDPNKIHFSEVGWDLSHDVNWDLNTGESPKKKKTKLDLLKKKTQGACVRYRVGQAFNLGLVNIWSHQTQAAAYNMNNYSTLQRRFPVRHPSNCNNDSYLEIRATRRTVLSQRGCGPRQRGPCSPLGHHTGGPPSHGRSGCTSGQKQCPRHG